MFIYMDATAFPIANRFIQILMHLHVFGRT